MGKQAGMGDQLYVGGVDLSGDTGSLGRIGGGPAASEVTGIDKAGFERIGGQRDGAIEWAAWFNDAALAEHVTLKGLPRTDRVVTYCRGTALGGQAAGINAKQVNYDPTRNADGSLSFAVQALGSGFGLEWGRQLTSGHDSLGAAGPLTSLDYGATIGETLFGLQAYLHVFSVTGTSATVAIQDSADDGTDPWTDITGAVFAAATPAGSPQGQRIQTARDEAVKRWLRVNVTGTFSALDFAVMVVKNEIEVTL